MIRELSTTAPRLRLPGYWNFAWMFVTKPISLRRAVLSAGVGELGIGRADPLSISSWRNQASRDYCLRLIFTGVVLAIIMTLLELWCTRDQLLSGKTEWQAYAISCAQSISSGLIIGILVGLETGIASVPIVALVLSGINILGSATITVLIGAGLITDSELLKDFMMMPTEQESWLTARRADAFSYHADVILSLVVGTIALVIGLVVSLGVWSPTALRGENLRASGVSRTIVLIGLTVGYFTGNVFGLLAGCVIFGSFLAGSFRLPVWIFELQVWSLTRRDLDRLPTSVHEISWLPYPGLTKELLAKAEDSPSEFARFADALRCIPGFSRTISRAEADLCMKAFLRAGTSGRWDSASKLELTWLSPLAAFRPIVFHFRAIASEVLAAEQPELPATLKRERLVTALSLLEYSKLPEPEVKHYIDRELHRYASVVVKGWRDVIEPKLHEVEAEASTQIPNVFTYTGISLDPTGGRSSERDTFRGREHCIQQVADALEQPQVSLAVIGPRRAGKTSLVKMMTVFLPSDLFIYVDLQSGAGASAEACYQAMDRHLAETLRRHADVSLPRLGERRHFAGVAEWIGELEEAAGRHRVVFCLDEYERLAELWSSGEQEMKQLLGLIRSTIQHRRRVRFLIAGASPLADMPPLWTDHFISAQEIRVDFLDHESAIGLLRKPTANFPDDAMPLEVAESIYARTVGQPHLVQCFGFRVLQRINKEGRKVVTLADVEAVEPRVVEDNNNYFADYRSGPEPAQRALEALARDETPEWKSGARHWLRTRGYLTADDKIRVPVFKQWLRRYLAERE